jgi:ABC-type sulfate transport system permease component
LDGIASPGEKRVRTGLRVLRRVDRALKAAAAVEGLTKEEKLERILIRELAPILRGQPPTPGP